MPSTQSSRFTVSGVTKHGHCDGSSQHSGKAEDERGAACVVITICDPCREAGQLARFMLQGALSPKPFLMGRHRHRTAANKRQRDEVLGGASNKSGYQEAVHSGDFTWHRKALSP